jgi:hypothetical protein
VKSKQVESKTKGKKYQGVHLYGKKQVDLPNSTNSFSNEGWTLSDSDTYWSYHLNRRIVDDTVSVTGW